MGFRSSRRARAGIRPRRRTVGEGIDGFGMDVVWPFLGWVVAPVLALAVLYFAGQELGPTWNAAHGKGTQGIFVAREESCSTSRGGSESCSWKGDFTAEDGSVRRSVWYHEDPDSLGVGGSVKALDTGSRNPTVIYPRSGSTEWIWVVGAIVVCLGVLATWLVFLLVWRHDRGGFRRRRGASTAPSEHWSKS